jgi:Protein of unknown function (DUF732)
MSTNKITKITKADKYCFHVQWLPRCSSGEEELTVSTIASRTAVIAFRATRLLVVVVALLPGPLRTAATARADTNDNKFLSVLKSEGITDHVSPSHAIEAAHTVCQKLDQGMTPTQVANDVLNSSNMPAYHSGYFVGASIDAYCPQYKSKISANS